MCHLSVTHTIAVRITEAHNITSEHFSDFTVLSVIQSSLSC